MRVARTLCQRGWNHNSIRKLYGLPPIGGDLMFCPECGTHLPYDGDRDTEGTIRYPQCPCCKVVWVGESGGYMPDDPIVGALQSIGREHRRMGSDIIAARTLEILEQRASIEDGVTYTVGTHRHKLVIRYTPSKCTYMEHEGASCLSVTRDRALQLIRERK